MKKRIIKRRNQQKINSILAKVSYSYTIEKKVFGNGYFLYTFPESSIAWFWLKEFPDWKFGIWLSENDNSYHIFGEAVVQIDKFKPSASSLSMTDVVDFVNELKKVKNNSGEWKEYNENTEKAKAELEISNEVNKKRLNNIVQYVNKVKEEFEQGKVKSFLEIVDRNTKELNCSPRYSIEEYAESSKYFETEEGKKRSEELYNDLCEVIGYSGCYTEEYLFLDLDDFIFENKFIQNKEDQKDKKEWFKK